MTNEDYGMSKWRSQQPESFRFGSEKLDEVAAVLKANPEATDREICDVVNSWWSEYMTELAPNDTPVSVYDVARIRRELGIPEAAGKPVQKRLFDP